MIAHINDEDIEFCECLYNSICMAESLFSDFDSLSQFVPEKLGHLRIGQFPLMSHEYLIDDDPRLSEKDNFSLRAKAGESFVFSARNFGKTLTTKLDIIISFILYDGWQMGVTSYDAIHIRGLMEPVIQGLESHNILKYFCKNIKRSPTYLITSTKGATIEGINMNVNSRNPGCYDKETEVLTDSGWKYFKDLSYKDKVLSLDLEKSKNDFYPIKKILRFRYNGLLKKLKNRTSEFLVTHNHNLVIKEKNKLILKNISKIKEKNFLIPNYIDTKENYLKFKKSDIENVTYNDYVYSVEVEPYHTIFVRRNNCVMWSGNSQFFQKHMKKLFIEEQSFETDEVYEKRRDSKHELGCIERGCIAEDSNILMSDFSTKKIQDIKIGDKIIGWNDKKLCLEKTVVKGFFNSGIRDVIELSNIKNSLWLTPEHKIWCKRKNSVKWEEASVVEHDECFNDYIVYENIKYKKRFNNNKLSIKDNKKNIQVYDIETGVNSFIANGFIVHNSGMTNFTKHSPAGRIFYDLSLKPAVLNLPQYINPFWDEKEKERAIKKFGGEGSAGYRVFVKGEVVETGSSVFDMSRIRPFYNEERTLKSFEINKDKYPNFIDYLVIEKPKNASNIFICADIGESAPTEIVIISEVNKIFKLLFNVTLFELTDKEQYYIFKFLAEKVGANFIGLDTTDGTGRSIYRRLEEVFRKENLVWVNFAEKISVDFDRDENNSIIYKNGLPTYVEEYVSEWSIKHLKDILYDGKIEVPEDAYKFDTQVNSVKAFISGTRTIYESFAPENHFLQAFQVFSIAHWMNEFNLIKPIPTKKFAKGFF